jgi:hypothetical protein
MRFSKFFNHALRFCHAVYEMCSGWKWFKELYSKFVILVIPITGKGQTMAKSFGLFTYSSLGV